RHGRGYGLAAALGIALANGLYIALAIGGFSLLQRAPLLLAAMQWLAALYLAWLGWVFWRAGRHPAVLPAAPVSAAKVAP
ncbi:LysE family transporter, partial [Salmonella enterica]